MTASTLATYGVSLIGFQSYPTNFLSINLTVSNVLTTGLRISASVLDDTVLTFLSVHYIAVGSSTYFL